MKNTFLDLANARQSDRSYSTQAIETDKLDRILEAARLAPSACNAQPWRIIVVNDVELKNRLADATSSRVLMMNHFTKQAPVHLVVVEESANFSSGFGSWAKKKHFPHIDLGIVAEHICLAAADEGLGSCMIGWFDEARVKQLLQIPRSKRPILIITLGYPNSPTREKRRKAIAEIVSYNKYEN
ncbi:MAG: nitroreductase family protein [Prevotellaceae bacterium]|jgi:nitroreductase|nr:nitroreductase family protein [Prevotellaceae bacterium]